MRVLLTPHPDTPFPAVHEIAVDVAREAGVLRLKYVLSGEVARVAWPAPRASARADELWRATCFEAFVRAPGEAGYYELNFSPSNEWAAYRFSGYREGMGAAGDTVPMIEILRAPTSFTLAADVRGLHGLPADGPWDVGLSAVLEDLDGAKSYWALAHAPGKPDFHHADSFALSLEHT
jgi:hypothetical protein